jgi:hypothetical protein
MAFDYVVQDNDTLLTIAQDNGFASTKPLLDANPNLAQSCQGNFDVLMPGTQIHIPDVQLGEDKAPSECRTSFVVNMTRKDLVITIQGPDGKPITRGVYKIAYDPGDGKVEKSGKLSAGTVRIEDFPTGVSNALLTIHLEPKLDTARTPEKDLKTSIAEGPPYIFEKINLIVGGLDPLVIPGSDRNRAVQKILTNLGFYSGDIDGDLTSSKSQAAIRKFQHLAQITPSGSAVIDDQTIRRLVDEQRNKIACDNTPFSEQQAKLDNPLQLNAKGAAINVEQVTNWSRYLEPTSGDQNTRKKFGDVRFFPRQAFVAVCDSGKNDNANVIRMKFLGFIFLDSGRWLASARDFSVIYGRHVYRCEYARDAGVDRFAPSDSEPICAAEDRLDAYFFRGMSGRVRVLQSAVASWAPDYEFDWSKLIIVIPDMHLMTYDVGLVFRSGNFDLGPELDLLDFASQLVQIDGLQGNVSVIQIGDAYDLWIGCTPRYFKKNPDHVLELDRPQDQKWNCGNWHCEGHPSPSEICTAPDASWRCLATEPLCPGYHKSPTEHCPEGVGTYWSCGRATPPCPGAHTHRADLCPDDFEQPGNQWLCRKTEPPCPGHPNKSDHCPSQIDTISQVCQWIRRIQGVGEHWAYFHLKEKKLASNVMSEFDRSPDESLIGLNVGPGKNVWLNPAEKALRLMQDNCTFIYGNHDNYLINGALARAAGIPARKRLWESPGIFIEHGHRLEASLMGSGDPFPTNYDGSVTGYEAAADYYKDCSKMMRLGEQPGYIQSKKIGAADWAAQKFQQPQYWGEFAQVMIGRRSRPEFGHSAPHVFVIGHTHMPMLSYINISYSKWF